MGRSTPRRLVYGSLLGVILLSGSSALFVNCTPTDHTNSPTTDCRPSNDHEHHHPPPHLDAGLGTAPNYISCSGTADCNNSAYFPTCGNFDNVECIAPNTPSGAPKQCVFSVDPTAGCFCIERDIRNCSLGGGGTGGGTQGIQHCVATGGWATGWGGCGGC